MNVPPTVIPNADDYLETRVIFGGIKRTIFSKNFKGGSINNIFGSTEIDLSGADINGTAVLDITQAFGELIITVPADWHIDADFSQFMATIEDYRNNVYQTRSTEKMLLLKGNSSFGLVQIQQHN